LPPGLSSEKGSKEKEMPQTDIVVGNFSAAWRRARMATALGALLLLLLLLATRPCATG
jgi:hypothetical protein